MKWNASVDLTGWLVLHFTFESAYLKTPKVVVQEVNSCDELRSHFVEQASLELEQVESDLEDDDLTAPQRKVLLKLRDAMQDEDD